MPRITVTSDPTDGGARRTLLDETVHPDELDADRRADAFIERLGWAILDAHGDETAGLRRPVAATRDDERASVTPQA